MGDDTLMYRVYDISTGGQVGGAYCFDTLGLLFVNLFFNEGLMPKDIRVERVKGE